MSKIEKVFDIDQIRNLQADKQYIQQYYSINQLAYSFFHNLSDQIHMGISRTGKYRSEDLLEAARVVERYMSTSSQVKSKVDNILELGTGRGATSAYLAKKYPNIRFSGVDSSSEQLRFAYKRAYALNNYFPVVGDYHDLTPYKSNSFDIVFEVEAFCHSQKKEIVFKEVKRILKKGGVFILFDGYLKIDRPKLTPLELAAVQITEKGMAVESFETYNDVIKKARNARLRIKESEDVSRFIIPTLKRFEKLADYFFDHPRAAHVIKSFLPRPLTYNAVSGYLMPQLIDLNLGCYFITVLQK